MTDRERQMYEKRVCNKLKNIIGNMLKLSNDKDVRKIVEGAFHGALSAIESRNGTTALVEGNTTNFDGSFYGGIGSGVKEAPETYYDIQASVEQENTEPCVTQEKGLLPEMDTELKEFEGRVNEFWKSAESATRRGELKSLEVDEAAFFLEYSEDSTIHVAEITDGARDLGLTGETGYGRDIIKTGKSEVEIITVNDIRYYTDLADGSDIVLTFPTSLGELEVRLYPDEQDQNLVMVEGNKEMLKKLEDCGEEIGKNCRLGRLLVKEAIGQGYFTRSGGLMRSEAMSPYEKVLGKDEAVEGLEPGSIVNSSLDNTSSKCGSTYSVERFTLRSG